ncbi:hypothetical protein [Proteiniphilum propionicum]|jgi:hypothetical protein|uniref:hypothetical protein n=1 Tax=Proteiniphilum propionicum TaxID=2829812 RepID=UPI001EEAC9FD|nr:hypothetical protein [Proteiniphilum propionicum]ULB35652.1 hypothetical protein KDN43_06370 [Proteiniphilum propionicum]
MAKVNPHVKRRYNLCYRARKKGYKIITPTRTIYRPNVIDSNIEKQLYEFGFAVQLTIYDHE